MEAKKPRRTAERILEVTLDLFNRFGEPNVSTTLLSADLPSVATSMVVVLTYWLSYEYVRDPRKALEPDQAGATLARGAWHVLSLLTPYLEPAAREHLQRLAGAYKS